MLSGPTDGDVPEELVADRPDPKEVLRRSFIKGAAIVFPLVITLFVVSFVLGFVWAQINPIVAAVVSATFLEGELFVTLTTLVVFLALVFVIGAYAEYGSNRGFSNQFDEFMASIPGVGSVYTSFNEMSELLLDSDTDSFQDVKLVEYPGRDSYVVAFKTAETPDVVARDTGNDDMVTLFMPMAPNPVMGGFVIYVSRERVVDVDLTVEQGIRSIVTSGVAIGEDEDFVAGLDEEQMRLLGRGDAGNQRDEPPSKDIDGGRPDRGRYDSSGDDLEDEDDVQLSDVDVEKQPPADEREDER